MYRQIISDTRGNFSVILAIMLMVLVVGIGGAIDLAQVQSHKSRLQDISDISALAATKGRNLKQMKNIANDSIQAHNDRLPDNLKVTKIEIMPKKNGEMKNVMVRLTAEYQTAFLGIIGKKTLTTQIYSEVAQDVGDVEISLVLDVSFSMSGGKIARLKTAAKDFVDEVMGDEAMSDNISMNIIPFGGNVNLGDTMASQLMPASNANWDPSDQEYKSTASSPDSKADALYRFTDGMNCVESKNEDYDSSVIPSNSRSQLPRFMHQTSLLTICPEDESSILYNSATKQDIKDKIDQLVLSHGTGMDVGAMWGLKTLSPSYRGLLGGDFSNRPSGSNDSTQKILVIMTDGNITGQGRPRKPNDPNRLTNPSSMKNQQLYRPGSPNSSSSKDTASGRFKKICEEAAANNINVFTIGFKIERGGSADKLLSYCASDSSKYLFVEKLNPASAFDEIAKSISQLRVVQ